MGEPCQRAGLTQREQEAQVDSQSEKLRASGAVLKSSRSYNYRADVSKVRQKMSLCRMQPLPLLTSQVPHAGCQASRPSTVAHSWEGQILGACHPS